MEKDLHKRLEEAADIYAKRIWNNLLEVHISKTDFLAGAELGYKEAIKIATEWLETNIANQVEMMCAEGPLMMDKRTFLADFESDMNQLWEG